MKVKIIGAGSIGNHLAQASRRMGWDVVMVDSDPKALERMKTNIYPSRYGAWDEAIQLFGSANEPKGNFDIIMIGTPPDIRMGLAIEAIKENPKILHLEKPVCTPRMELVDEFKQVMKNYQTIVTVGYDHAVAESIEAVVELLKQKIIGDIFTMDVEFREHWQRIFAAHPWFNGPQDTYLSYWQRGGGAGGEHSHALHLWQYLAQVLGWGRVSEAKAMFSMRNENGAEYDQIATFLLKTKQGKIGRVVQDVITYPVRKWVRIQGDKGFIEWFCNGVPEGDLVRYQVENEDLVKKVFKKTRPDDFYRVILHYQKLINGEVRAEESPVSLERGLEVMKILEKAYRAA